MAGNQLGKTVAGGAEVAYHLTGRYPDWWQGRVFDRPVKFWAGGDTGETTRDNPQRILIGPPADESAWGTGMIPGDTIIDTVPASGIADFLDVVLVKHVTGGTSMLKFKTYVSGRKKWQGETLDGVWFDEEPPPDVYSEGFTRTNVTKGLAILTFTPLEGVTEVVRGFLKDAEVEAMVKEAA